MFSIILAIVQCWSIECRGTAKAQTDLTCARLPLACPLPPNGLPVFPGRVPSFPFFVGGSRRATARNKYLIRRHHPTRRLRETSVEALNRKAPHKPRHQAYVLHQRCLGVVVCCTGLPIILAKLSGRYDRDSIILVIVQCWLIEC